jgi:hypothetical protein
MATMASLGNYAEKFKMAIRAVAEDIAMTAARFGAYSARGFVRIPQCLGGAWLTKKYQHPHGTRSMGCAFFDFQS